MKEGAGEITPPQLTLSALPLTDLVSRAQRGSLPCFAELVRRFEGRLFNFLCRRTGSTHDAEDLAQDAFVRAWQRIDQYNPQWQFSTWLFTIGHRLALTHLQRRRREQGMCKGRDIATAQRDDPGRIVADHDQCDLLWETADLILTPSQGTILWLRYAEELSNKQIAVVMGRSQVSVRVTLFRAREALAAHEQAPGSRARDDRRAHQAAGLTKTLEGDLVC